MKTRLTGFRCIKTELREKELRPVLRGVIDARDFDGVLLDLVNRYVGRKNQFAPSRHASGAATAGKVAQCLAPVIDGFHGLAGRSRIILRNVAEYAFQVFDGEG